MEIIQKFGLEARLFLFQLVNFLIIVFVLKKFLFAPLKKMLDERKRKIEQSLQDAENAKIILGNAAEEKKKILAEAKSSADMMMATTKVSIEETKEKAAIEAKSRSEHIVEEAKQRAATEFENMNKKIGKMSVDISGKVMSKVLSNLFTEDEKQKLISRALEKIDENITN
ncbi:F0F1 ATP synthase subunit B [Candidatus Endomicrobiellum agilis]|uniref:F0F1 ATP synthase subunit B n=1 Tax=Candidatus Endomicrobiellum agilis TaxID=3238957 RepID=UPI00357724D8|nr:F0F1 ATP synthase subunit B [Endomicrobium sp.]